MWGVGGEGARGASNAKSGTCHGIATAAPKIRGVREQRNRSYNPTEHKINCSEKWEGKKARSFHLESKRILGTT